MVRKKSTKSERTRKDMGSSKRVKSAAAGETQSLASEPVEEKSLPAGIEPQADGPLSAETSSPRIVRGQVRLADGTPFAGVLVRVYDKDLRYDEFLGEMNADQDGRFEIGYTAAQFTNAEKDAADLLVQAVGPDGTLLAAAEILFNAPSLAEVEVIVPAEAWQPPTLFEKIGAALPPLLQDLKVEELEENEEHRDLSFLSGETGFEKRDLARYALSYRLARPGLEAEAWFAVAGSSIFVFSDDQSLAQRLTAVFESLPSLDEATLRKSFARVFNQREIPASLQERVSGWVEAFLMFAAGQLLNGGKEPAFVKLALENAGIDDLRKQVKFAELFNLHKRFTPELLTALKKDPAFKEDEIADLHTSFRLVELTHGDFSVVRMLKQQFELRRPEDIRPLAKRSQNEWVGLVKKWQAAGEIDLPIPAKELEGQATFPQAEFYARVLERQFSEAFPTAAFAGGLERALQNGGTHGLSRAESLKQLLAFHENFEFLKTSVDEFLASELNPELKPLAEDEGFKLELKAIQRVFKLVPTFEATDTLLADGIHSAQQIYRMGETQFVRRYADSPGFTAESAQLAWNRAADTYAAVLTIVGDLKSLEDEVRPVALRMTSNALTTFPNWDSLFKTGDLCDCESCRSVLSPAAYFADLLTFLRDRWAGNATVKDVLFGRRADLGYLELSCENAQTPLPYVDVVCEVLEQAVAPNENDIELTGLASLPTNPVAAKRKVLIAFTQKQINLGADFSLSQVNPGNPDLWVVHGDDATYLMKKKTTSDFFAQILCNTKASAEELRAYPQYVNPKAYDKLEAVKYPSALPFDLFAEEVRAAFRKINLRRWDLMRTLRGLAAPNNPTDSDIASEYFGISVDPGAAFDEKRLILVADTTVAGQQEVWGEVGNVAWLQSIGKVKTFLQKTGLEYNEMLALLDLKFINPKRDIYIDFGNNPACDTDKQFIKPLMKPDKLDRIHRFLRLWRKLPGWQMWELDLALHQPAIGNGALDETFLTNLFYFNEVKNKLGAGTTVEQTLALFENLNIETYFTKAHEQRGQGLYQNLFLNKKLARPLDPAFAVNGVNVPAPTTEKITGHHPVVLAVLGISEANLLILEGLTKASNSAPYISNDLTLENLSFLWRHAWLSKLLKFKVQDWKILLEISRQDIPKFDSPKVALEFLEMIDQVKATGFTPDELAWLLAADRSASAAMKETEAGSFLLALRRQLQAIRDEYAIAQYNFLSATTPTDEGQLAALLIALFAKLNRSEDDARLFLATLRGRVLLKAEAPGLPPGFVFPATLTGAPNYIPIRYDYDPTNATIHFTGLMTSAQQTSLLSAPAIAALAAAAMLEADVSGMPPLFVFPGALNNIPIQYDEQNGLIRFTGLMTETQRATLLNDASLPAAVTANSVYQAAIEQLFQDSLAILNNYQNAIRELYQQSLAAPAQYVQTKITSSQGMTLPADSPSIPLRYDPPAQTLTFIGVMTNAEKTALTAIASNPQAAIDELYARPRLTVKFFDPTFTAPLEVLPQGVDFKSQLPSELAARISYDAELRVLRFNGIPSTEERKALDALAPGNLPAEVAYRAAVASLAAQAEAITPPDERIWLTGADLDDTLPSTDTFAMRLANAAKKALAYLSNSFMANAVVEQSSAQLGITQSLTRRLMTQYNVLPGSLMSHLTGAFTSTTSAVTYAAHKTTFDAWFWANRVTAIWKKWKISSEDLDELTTFTASAQLLDFASMPLDNTGSIASLEKFLRTARLWRIRDSLPEDKVPFFEVLGKLNAGGYSTSENVLGLPVGFTFPAAILTALGRNSIRYDEPNTTLHFTGLMSVKQRSRLLSDASLSPVTGIAAYRQAIENLFTSLAQNFANDVQGVNGSWPATETQGLVTSLDIDDYLLSESWERLRRAYYFLDNLNGGAEALKSFAAASMGESEVKSLKELLRSKFGVETWLPLCTEIQDDLRERKRDALAAYLLTQPKPADAPSDKWENTNDLYAYYLLDVDMSACQLTSRLVQASGSVQLFVQRCLMGLEPAVTIDAETDSAWRWWEWMRKYRVWEANRKVFLWPENWIEPELKRDRSPFFKDMENELLQNEVNQDNAQAALLNYLDKLADVAQLEIAALYQEDTGYDSIVHVFGRTRGAEPHHYYYRRYDYRQWSPWEKVELDIQGDYLIPAVVNHQLFLFWPIFTEVPDEAGNSIVKVPALGQTFFSPDKTKKRLRLQMALSQYRHGQWMSKRVSKSYDESAAYSGEIVNMYYQFAAIDRSDLDGRFYIMYEGNSHDGTGFQRPARLKGEIEFSGCDGLGELIFQRGHAFTSSAYLPTRPESLSAGNEMISLKWVELDNRGDQPADDLTLETYTGLSPKKSVPVLTQTPGIYKIAPAWQYSYMDKLSERVGIRYSYSPVFAGTWLPFFYDGKDRMFFVQPVSVQGLPSYYPDIRGYLRVLETSYTSQVSGWVDSFIASLTAAQREDVIRWLEQRYGLPWKPSYTDAEFKSLVEQYPQEAVYEYLRMLSDELLQFQQFHFKNFYNPFLCDFTKLAYDPLEGIPALLSQETQMQDTGFDFLGVFGATQAVIDPTTDDFYPKEIVDFSRDGAYAPYNWELFFHAPLLIANALSRNQRFEEARNWYHFIFNPLGVASAMPGGSPMSKYWITKPFFETTDPQYVQQRIDNILRILAGDMSIPGAADTFGAILDSVFDWRTHPFEPHRIAGYRMVAYQKTVVMKYLDNLIAWGDYLFRQDSMESINEATQLYVLAAEILGPRPKVVPPPAKPPVETFNELEYRQLDAFSNAMVFVENLVPLLPGNNPHTSNQPPLPMLYFCIPQNEKLLGYWATVADRLYKIRHCMNIEGVRRQLALFEPPIDPGALVKAVAGGADINSALADLSAPLPFYRFSVLLQKANELCSDVKALGAALLSALEKKDAESLALLRQDQEIQMLEAVKAVRQQQIDEALENLEALKKNKELITLRRDYYQNIQKISIGELLYQEKLKQAFEAQQTSQLRSTLASVAHYIPTIDVGGAGAGGSPRSGVSFGGLNLGGALQAWAGMATSQANMENYLANKASINAGYERRWEDWKQQEKLANKELEQIDKSIDAAKKRIAIAQKELANHELQIENAKATDEFMRSKYTKEELYQWQVGQISAVYFQSYRLAYDLAKRAERCFRFELGLQDSSYIRFGYWDSLKKGLLSGEKLQYDLRRLETAYLEQNRREYELTKHVSLVLLDPLALIKLRETGRCFVRLPEEIFDLDYPGHYFRRIKSVSLTLPCVVGPYTTISCTLRLLKNSIRINTANGGNGYPHNVDDQGLPADDERFIENNIPVKAIAASSAQNDSGIFELSFRDERYLPFEGAGAISEWTLELFNDAEFKDSNTGQPDFGKALRQFDYNTISDVILHVKYTAREDAGAFKNASVAHLRSYFSQDDSTPALRMFNLRQEFPTQWSRFLNPVNQANGNVFELEMSPALFSWRDSEKTLQVNTIWVLARCADPGGYTVVMSPPLAPPPTPPAPDPNKMTLIPSSRYGGLHFGQLDVDVEISPTASPVKWQIKMNRPGGGNLQKDPAEVEDLMLVLGYQWE